VPFIEKHWGFNCYLVYRFLCLLARGAILLTIAFKLLIRMGRANLAQIQSAIIGLCALFFAQRNPMRNLAVITIAGISRGKWGIFPHMAVKKYQFPSLGRLLCCCSMACGSIPGLTLRSCTSPAWVRLQ
jgi:hypothetical protein